MSSSSINKMFIGLLIQRRIAIYMEDYIYDNVDEAWNQIKLCLAPSSQHLQLVVELGVYMPN